MIPEDTLKLIEMRRNPVNSLQDLSKKLIGTREGFIFYTTNFRKDFETKMYMLGHLEKENQQLNSLVNSCQQEIRKLKSTLEEIREYVKGFDFECLHEVCEHNLVEVLEYLLQIIDKGVK